MLTIESRRKPKAVDANSSASNNLSGILMLNALCSGIGYAGFRCRTWLRGFTSRATYLERVLTRVCSKLVCRSNPSIGTCMQRIVTLEGFAFCPHGASRLFTEAYEWVRDVNRMLSQPQASCTCPVTRSFARRRILLKATHRLLTDELCIAQSVQQGMSRMKGYTSDDQRVATTSLSLLIGLHTDTDQCAQVRSR